MEFTLTGVPLMFMIIATVQLCMGMWTYHTLAYAVKQGARYVVVRGQGCTANGNTCSITVDGIANRIAAAAIGVPAGRVNVTLTTASGQQQACQPLSSCFGNMSVWPPASNNDNFPGKDINISARYAFPCALAMFWPGAGTVQFGTVVLPASSTQRIVF